LIQANGTRAADDAAIQQAINRGAAWLQGQIGKETDSGVESLSALALLKSQVPANSPAIQDVVQKVLQRVQNGEYTPNAHHVYQAGVEATLLADINPEGYRPQIEAIANYIIGQQLPNGGWDYPTGRQGIGDTSVVQYACLGLWAATRAGIEVPITVWDNAINWHINTQNPDGGFAYVPGTQTGNEQGASSINLTLAALGSLFICARHALPGRADSLAQLLDLREERKTTEPPKFGVLETVDLTAAPQLPPGEAPPPTTSTVDVGRLKECVQRGFNWASGRIGPTKGDNYYHFYFYYTLERMASLADIQQFGRINWYPDCAAALMSIQSKEGSWTGTQAPNRETAFALLFLARSTGKILKRTVPVDPLGGGLLAGGRGNLDATTSSQKKDLGPLDQLLAALENPTDVDLEEVQEQIVEKVQIGDRNVLIGQKDLLVRYVKHPNAEVRRTAVWALGRSDDLSLARLLIDALDDVDVGVIIEARNALCWLARKPNGLGEAEDPLQNLPPEATEEQKKAAIAAWHAELVRKWGAWYLQNRPYADRGDEFEAQLLQKIAAAAG
jgi:hypothetical protein